MTKEQREKSMETNAKISAAGMNCRSTDSPVLVLLAAALTVLLLAALLLPSPATARTTRALQGSFGSFSSGGPSSLAVDQSTGDVYGIDHVFVGTVSRFNSFGAPKNFTAGPDAGTNVLTSLSGVAIAAAVDNSGGPLDGTIYVAVSGGSTRVEALASDGTNLGTISGTGTFSGICGIAVDQASGALYLSSLNQRKVWRYAPSSPSGAIDSSDYTVTGITVNNPCDLAADSGDLYVHSGSSFTSISKFSASSFTTDFPQPQGTAVDTGDLRHGPKAVAVDSQTGELYVNEGHKVTVYDSTGLRLYSFGAAAYFGDRSEGIAVRSSASGPATTIYVADPQVGARKIDVFGSVVKAPNFTRPEIAAFGPDGTSGSSFLPFSIGSLAFDQASRRLYGVDRRNGGVFGFSASSPPAFPPLSGFSPLLATTGFGSGIAVDNTVLGSAGNLYLASQDTDLLYGWNSAASPLGGAFPVDPATSPGPPTGSPKNLCGTVVDSQGNVWVANAQTEQILKYDSNGTSLSGTIDVSAQGVPCELAFDSSDDLYVRIIDKDPNSKSGIWKYTAASSYASAAPIAALPHNENSIRFAVDLSNDHLYVAVEGRCGGGGGCNIQRWIDEYDPAGNLVDEFTVNSDGFHFGGIAVEAISHSVYVVDSRDEKDLIRVFGAGVLLPEVTPRPASDHTNTTVMLNGLVNTQTVTLDDCYFEYVTEADFRLTGFSNLDSGGNAPCSPAAGSIPLDLDEHPVSATATSLTENTVYRFRLVAANANGTHTGEGSFSSTGRPLVETTGAPIRSAISARLEGRVYAHGEATNYHFEYGTEGPCDANPCESTKTHSAGSGSEFQLVSQLLEGLEPSTTYYYRLIADNGNPLGPGIGVGMTVTTLVSDTALSHGDFPGPPGSDRAYEQVSIPDSSGNPVVQAFAVSDAGDRAFYKIQGGTSISTTGSIYGQLFAERVEDAPHQGGWRSQNLGPSRNQLIGPNWLDPVGRSDLSDQIVVNQDNVTFARALWRLRPDQSAAKVFDDPNPENLNFVLVSQDASRVLALLTGTHDPAHPVSNSALNLYDVSSGTPELVGLLPGGSVPTCGASIGDSQNTNAPRTSRRLSSDGSLVFFKSCSNLYLRDIDAEETKLIAGNSNFVKSTADAVFFTTGGGLESGDTGGNDVYRYDLADESLECVTCAAPAGLDAAVIQAAVAADGSRVYFSSSNALLPGGMAGGIYRVNVASGDLVYVGPGIRIDEDSTSAVAALTPDGSVFVFASAHPSLSAVSGQQNGGARQYYRYDDRDRSLICLSCPQDGDAPPGPISELLFGPGDLGENAGANKTVLSADGSIFAFATPYALLPADQNTARAGQNPVVGTDVYEWRAGRLLLITDGLTQWPPDSQPGVTAISPSGNDVFFLAAAQYTPDALDSYMRLYTARIGGGFEFPPPPKPCPLEVCQGTPKGAPAEQAPGTGSFTGPGNVSAPARRSCPKGMRKVRKGGKTRCSKTRGEKRNHKRAKHQRRAQR